MIPIPKPIKPLPIKTTDVDLWVDGVVTALDEGRLGVEALTEANNMILDEDGTLRPRPSLRLFGPQPTGTVLGKPGKFTIVNGTTRTRYLIIVQVVSGTAAAYIAKPEDTIWTMCSGETFNTSVPCTFVQGANKVLILNGTDDLTYLDLATVPSSPTLTRLVPLSNPTTAPTLSETGLTGSVYTVWYAYTYNSTVGETAGSTSAQQLVSIDRSGWNPSTESVSVTIPTPPTGVESWNLYCATTSNGASTPTLLLIAAGISPTQTSYIDNGSSPQLLNRSMPLINSTSGPLATRGVFINGRFFLYLDNNNPYNIAIGGDYGFELDFSPANGGDSLPVGYGTGELPTVVWNFRSGPGDPEIKCLTSGTPGKRYTIAQSSVTYNGTQVEIWGAQEDYGLNGTEAAGSLISYEDSVYYLGWDSFYTTGTEPELQNLLHTKSVSQTLSLLSDFASINQSELNLVDGTAWQQRLYWCLPIASNTNNQIWTLDLKRGGAWMKPWSLNCQGIMVIQDNLAQQHQLFLVNNSIYESTYELLTNDEGVIFPTGAGTGVIAFSADQRTWAQVMKIVITLLRAQGTINFTVLGWTMDSSRTGLLETIGQYSFENLPSILGYGWNQGPYNQQPMYPWNNFYSIPLDTVPLTADAVIPINQQIRYFLVQMNTDTKGCDFNVSNIIPLFVTVGVKNLE